MLQKINDYHKYTPVSGKSSFFSPLQELESYNRGNPCKSDKVCHRSGKKEKRRSNEKYNPFRPSALA